MASNPERQALVGLPDGAAWDSARSYLAHLMEEARNPRERESIGRMAAAITALAREGGRITAAGVSRYCVDRWGGPRAQSIANNGKLAQLVGFARVAQGKPPSTPGSSGADGELLKLVGDPAAKAAVQVMLTQLESARRETATIRRAMRRVSALGVISPAMASAAVEDLESLARRVADGRLGEGITFPPDERKAVQELLDNLPKEGFAFDESSGELLSKTKRTVAGPALRRALLRILDRREPPIVDVQARPTGRSKAS